MKRYIKAHSNHVTDKLFSIDDIFDCMQRTYDIVVSKGFTPVYHDGEPYDGHNEAYILSFDSDTVFTCGYPIGNMIKFINNHRRDIERLGYDIYHEMDNWDNDDDYSISVGIYRK